MMNLDGYIQTFGKHTFAVKAFNDVDNLLFSYLVYYDFREIVPAPGVRRQITVGDAARLYRERIGSGQKNVDEKLLYHMGESARLKDVLLSEFLCRTGTGSGTHEDAIQFAALHAQLPGGVHCICFRGIDMDIAGWYEAIRLAYMTVPSQRLAATYLDYIGDKTSGPILVMGHSKGGNMAVYAAICCRDSVKSRIRRVYTNDGPALSAVQVHPRSYLKMKKRIRKITPAHSVIGMLFEMGEPDLVVKSSFRGIRQHEPLSWQVRGSHFVRAEGRDRASRRLSRAINRWISGVVPEERRLFADDISRILERGSGTFEFGWRFLRDVLKEAGPETRRLLGRLLGELQNARREG